MKLIVESGATKSVWVLLDQGKVIDTQYLKGINATSNPKSIEYISEYKPTSSASINSIYFYGAGVSSPVAIEHLEAKIKEKFACNDVHLHHDILGAARAVSAGTTSIVSILGTGTNTVVFDGVDIQQSFKAMGYLFADYGSGYHIGKQLLRSYYSKQMSQADKVKFEQEYITGKADMLYRIYSADKPNFVTASLTKFLGVSSDELKASILQEVFSLFFQKQILIIDGYKDYGLTFVGSIAKVFEAELRLEAEKHKLEILRIMSNPIDGLINYHAEN